jgi:hypothetical protein
VREEDTQKGAWWCSKPRNAYLTVCGIVNYLERQNRGQREDTRFFMELASNFNIAGNGCENSGWFGRAAGGKMRRNLCQSLCDVASSLILQNRTVPMAVTSDGDYALARLAERWTRAIQGQFYNLKVFDIAPDVGRDALETGTGFVLGYVEMDEKGKPRPVIERVLPNEILVDAVDGQYREPRSLYRIKLVARETLIAAWPKFAAKLRTSGGPTPHNFVDFSISKTNKADFVRVIEAWHLPTMPGKADGRHVICTDNVDLVDEPYAKEKFPIRAYRYVVRRVGFWGQGLVERVMPCQVRLSEIQQAKRNMQRLCSNTYWMRHENCDWSWDEMSNLPGQEIVWTGQTPPQMVTFEGTPADLNAEEQQIVAEAMEQEGFSGNMVAGDVNKGLSSARAVRAADDVSSRRHVMPTRLYESLYLDMADLIAELNDQCAEIDPQYTVTGRYRAGRRSWIKEDLWTELKLPEGKVQITVFPISALPTTPMGLWSTLEEMTQAGMVSKEMAMELQGLPDVARFMAGETSSIDLAGWQIDRLMDGHEELPIPQQDLQTSIRMANQAMLIAYRMEAPQHVLDAFDGYMAYGKSLLEQPPANALGGMAPAALSPEAAAAAQIAAAPAPAMPGAPPLPPMPVPPIAA